MSNMDALDVGANSLTCDEVVGPLKVCRARGICL
jgi:hypothetical protein